MAIHDFPRVEIDALPPDGLRELLDGERVGFVIPGAFPPPVCAAAVDRLGDPEAEFEWTPQQHWDVASHHFVLLGESLTPYVDHPDGPDPDHYFASAERFRRDASRVFGPAFDFEARLLEALRPLVGGRAVRIAEGPAGRRYTPATIRRLPPGTAIPLHCGDFFLETGGYEHLRSVLDLVGQLSWFVPLQTPERGGELRVTDLSWHDPDVPRIEEGFWDATAIRATREFTTVVPGVGDMVVFDGGRWFHEVAQVRGARTRWTIGGFLGFTRDRDAVLLWN
jgi:hypothetical protein